MNERKEDDEKNMCMYQAFFEMMKEWIIKDYYNPSIKVEVVLDTLLSEFVGELLEYGFGDDRKFTLIAKEFPVKNDRNQKNLRSPKLDYLLEDNKKNLYFVELKTSSESFNEEQFARYEGYVNPEKGTDPVKKLWEHYKDILEKYKILNTYGKMQENGANSNKLKDTKKYVYQLCDLDKAEYVKFTSTSKEESKVKVEYNYNNIYLVYLSLEKIENNSIKDLLESKGNADKPEISQIVISEIINEENDITDTEVKTDEEVFTTKLSEEKKLKWEAVRTILKELIAKNGQLIGR